MKSQLLFQIYITLRMAHKDLLDFWKAKMLVATFTVMPIIMMTMFGSMFPQTGTANPFSGKVSSPYKNSPMAIVVEDTGSFGLQVADQFKQIASSTGLFDVLEFASFGSARERIVAGSLKGAVVIPAGFSEAFSSQRQATVLITTDDTNPQMASIIYGEASSIFKTISGRLSASFIAKMNNSVDASFISEPISVERRNLAGSTTNNFQFLAPGFMALTVVTGTLSGLAAVISREREQGTMDGLLVAPVPRSTIVVGKVLGQTVRGMIQASLILTLSILFFGVRIYGSPSLMALVMFMGVASFAGVGIILSAIASEQETAQMMMMLLQFPMMFLCGILFPIEQLPEWLQWVGKMLPLYYAADALRKVIVLGASFAQILPNLTIMFVYATITMAVAIPIFHKAMTR
ncbi:ABC transporter permease [Candidatus Bathyarchaeota archaeon]|nr:ABC transporter permease [Candidatus Bathyarchaeota archaeon]